MVTNLEIVDTAVKIGLGAIISGVIAYLMAKLSHANELESEFIKRRRDMVQSLAEQFQACHQRLTEFVLGRINEAIEAKAHGVSLSEKASAAFARQLEEFMSIEHELASVSARLRLLGDVETAKLVENYMTFVANLLERLRVPDARLVSAVKPNKMEDMRDKIFDNLQTLFRRGPS